MTEQLCWWARKKEKGQKLEKYLPETRPCPFCGGCNVYQTRNNAGLWAICCPDCRCIGPQGKELAWAARFWNDAPRKERP